MWFLPVSKGERRPRLVYQFPVKFWYHVRVAPLARFLPKVFAMCRIATPLPGLPRWLLFLLLSVAVSGCGPVGQTPQPPVVPTSRLGGRTITITTPQANAVVSSPIPVAGMVSLVPVAGSLIYQLFGPDDLLLAQGTFPTQGNAGEAGVFAGSLPYTLVEQGPGRLELLDVNPADGALLAMSTVAIILAPGQAAQTAPTVLVSTLTPLPPATAQQQIFLDSPPSGTTVGSPMTITGRTTQPPAGNTLSYLIRDAASALLGTGTFPVATTTTGTGSFNAALTFNLPPNGGNLTLEVFAPGVGNAPPVANAQLTLVVAPPQVIVLDSPPAGTTVGSPVTLTGRTARYPFQGALGYRLLDATGHELGRGTFPVVGAAGGPCSFTASLSFSLPPSGGRITVEVVDQSVATGEVAAMARSELNIAVQQQAITIESPSANQQVGSPMTVVGRVVQMPVGGQLTYRVRDQAGQIVGTSQLGITGSQDGGGRFTAQVLFTLPQGGPITLELLELDPTTGQVRASTSLPLTVAVPPSATPTAAAIPTAAATPVPPTLTPTPVAYTPNTPVPPRQTITIDAPTSGTAVGSPVVITGRVARPPQFLQLYYVVRTPTGDVLGQGSFPVAGPLGQTDLQYTASLNFSAPQLGGPIVVEIYDRDGVGATIASAIVQLQVASRMTVTPTPGPTSTVSR